MTVECEYSPEEEDASGSLRPHQTLMSVPWTLDSRGNHELWSSHLTSKSTRVCGSWRQTLMYLCRAQEYTFLIPCIKWEYNTC